MSFFIKGKRKSYFKGNNPVKKVNGYSKVKQTKEDNVTSSESEDGSEHEEFSENEDESVQEKKLRLAKIYLEEIEKQEKERLEYNDDGSDLVATRLKEDYLKQTGKFRKEVANTYKEVNKKHIIFLKCKEHKKTLTCLCVSSDNKFIFSGSKDGSIVKWSIEEPKKVASLPFKNQNLVKLNPKVEGHSSEITCIAVSDNFEYLAVGDESNDIQIWNPDTFAHIKTLKSHRNSLTGLVFRKCSNCLYSTSKDKSVKVWSLDEMCYLETLFGHQDIVMAVDALTRERCITAGGSDHSIRIWKIAEESQLLFNGTGNLDCVKLINEDHFITGGDSGEICVWSAMKKKPLCSIKNAHGIDPKNQQPLWITCVTSFVNTDLVASGSHDGNIKLWKLTNSCRNIEPLFSIPLEGFINSLSFTTDGKYLIAVVGHEHRCGRWITIKDAKSGVYLIPLIKT